MGKCLKKHPKKKQIKKTDLKNKTVVTIIFDGNFDRVNGPIDMRVWKGC